MNFLQILKKHVGKEKTFLFTYIHSLIIVVSVNLLSLLFVKAACGYIKNISPELHSHCKELC